MDTRMDYKADAESLIRLLKRLRAPDGCPWDRAQNRRTFGRCLKNECAEVMEALDTDDPAKIVDELGDLLMNVFMQIVVGEERGEFCLETVFGHVISKMIRRHEHVFGAATAGTPDEVLALWDKVKSKEKGAVGRKSAMDGVQNSLSALDRAEKLQKRAAENGFDWDDTRDVLPKIEEELSELKTAMSNEDVAAVDEEIGDLLFSIANLVRKRGGLVSEELLRKSNAKFERRYRRMEELLERDGVSAPDQGLLDEYWNKVKEEEHNHA